MTDFLKTFWQYLIPQHTLSGAMYSFANIEWPPLKNFVIKQFCKLYNVDLSEADRINPEDYRSFNDFFTRSLKISARPIDARPDAVISPVDGCISQSGDILHNQIIQAKGFQYSTEALLGGNVALANRFIDGQFSVIYLSPRDYHRIHMPLDAQLLSMMYVPGDLFAVNPATVRTIPELFARNERLVLEFECVSGKFAMVMVGAIFVGSMETVWMGKVTPPYNNTLQYWDYHAHPLPFSKGDEIARFNMGSTVVLLTEANAFKGLTAQIENTPIKMGQAIATISSTEINDDMDQVQQSIPQENH